LIGSDNGGGKEIVRSSGGRSFQRRDAVLDGLCWRTWDENWLAFENGDRIMIG